MRYEDASQSNSMSNENPVARDDGDALAAGSRGPATGNVISGAGTQTGTLGADVSSGDASITSISGAGGSDATLSGGKLSVAGEFGKLSVDAQGNYSYLANQGAPENSRDQFTYKLADSQGNSDTATLTIEIANRKLSSKRMPSRSWSAPTASSFSRPASSSATSWSSVATWSSPCLTAPSG